MALSPLPSAFKLERYMAKYEFQASHPLCLSDCEPLRLSEVLAMADEQCRQLWQQLSLGYTESDGHPLLREEIAKLYQTVVPTDVLVLVPQEAIHMAARALLEPGDHVICLRPAYQSLYEIALNIGCSVDFWEMKTGADGQPLFAVEDLQALLKSETKAVFVNFPHNPSGAVLSPDAWQKVIASCQACQAYLFSDEMYRGLEAESTTQLPAAVDCYDKAVSLSGMSKVYGMPGIRLGWLATKSEALRTKLQLLHDYFSICHAAPSEILALIGLRNRERLARENRELVASNVALAEQYFSRHADTFEFYAPQGSSIAFPRLITGQDVGEFCEELVGKTGVYLLPATVYDHQQSVVEGRFRLGLGRKNLAVGLRALDEHLNATRAGGP